MTLPKSAAAPRAPSPSRTPPEPFSLQHHTLTIHPSLHNAAQTTLPLLIYIPPSPSPSPPSPTSLPPLLRPYPTAIIHYRWSANPPPPTSGPPTPHHWPTPLHDISFAYAHIATHLSPPYPSRRPLFILSSHVGASLATSLALTEAHPHRHFAVRGLAVYNGVYNWSMFLPDHRVHHDDKAPPGCTAMDELGRLTPGLFRKPANLFDPFASPSLFFRTAGLDAPPSFHPQTDYSPSLSDDEPPEPTAPPPRAAHVLPPPATTHNIPQTHQQKTPRTSRPTPARSPRLPTPRLNPQDPRDPPPLHPPPVAPGPQAQGKRKGQGQHLRGAGAGAGGADAAGRGEGGEGADGVG